MESPRELKRRLASIRTTGQLAGAMRTVASARYSRLSALSGPYAEYVKALESMCMRLGLTDDTGESCGEVPECWVLVGADRGLCGAYNSELFSYFDREYEKCAVRPLVAVSGKMARAHCAAKGIETAAVFSFSALPTYQEAAKAADVLSGLCDSGRLCKAGEAAAGQYDAAGAGDGDALHLCKDGAARGDGGRLLLYAGCRCDSRRAERGAGQVRDVRADA